MRVTIEHREQPTGVLKNHKESFIDCRVEFSEEEKAIIKTRDLYRDGFSIRAATPVPSTASFWGTNLMRLFGPAAALVGFFWATFGDSPLGGLLCVLGIGFSIYGWLRGRKENKRFANSEQRITIKKLLANPSFTVHGWNPAAAKNIENELRDDLAGLKNLIQNSAEIKGKQSFEL